jgi:chromosome segregation ATPase
MAMLDREQEVSESKLQTAEAEIEELTQRLYDKSSTVAGLKTALGVERLKLTEAEAVVANSLLVSSNAADSEAADQAAELESQMEQMRIQLAAVLNEAEITRQQLNHSVGEANVAKTEAAQATAAQAAAAHALETCQHKQAAGASLVRQHAEREKILESRIADLEAEIKAAVAQLVVKGSDIAINIAAAVQSGKDGQVSKGTKEGNLEGVKNLLGALGFRSRLDSQTKMYMLVLHVLVLVLMFNCH